DVQESVATVAAAKAQSDVTLGRQLPSLALKGTYTRNEYDVELPLSLLQPGAAPGATLTLTPFNQLDGYASLNVPLVDLESFKRIGAADTSVDAAQKQGSAVWLQVEAQVAQTWYQLVADLALVTASQRALDVAKAGAELTRTRVSLGQA